MFYKDVLSEQVAMRNLKRLLIEKINIGLTKAYTFKTSVAIGCLIPWQH